MSPFKKYAVAAAVIFSFIVVLGGFGYFAPRAIYGAFVDDLTSAVKKAAGMLKRNNGVFFADGSSQAAIPHILNQECGLINGAIAKLLRDAGNEMYLVNALPGQGLDHVVFYSNGYIGDAAASRFIGNNAWNALETTGGGRAFLEQLMRNGYVANTAENQAMLQQLAQDLATTPARADIFDNVAASDAAVRKMLTEDWMRAWTEGRGGPGCVAEATTCSNIAPTCIYNNFVAEARVAEQIYASASREFNSALRSVERAIFKIDHISPAQFDAAMLRLNNAEQALANSIRTAETATRNLRLNGGSCFTYFEDPIALEAAYNTAGSKLEEFVVARQAWIANGANYNSNNLFYKNFVSAKRMYTSKEWGINYASVRACASNPESCTTLWSGGIQKMAANAVVTEEQQLALIERAASQVLADASNKGKTEAQLLEAMKKWLKTHGVEELKEVKDFATAAKFGAGLRALTTANLLSQFIGQLILGYPLEVVAVDEIESHYYSAFEDIVRWFKELSAIKETLEQLFDPQIYASLSSCTTAQLRDFLQGKTISVNGEPVSYQALARAFARSGGNQSLSLLDNYQEVVELLISRGISIYYNQIFPRTVDLQVANYELHNLGLFSNVQSLGQDPQAIQNYIAEIDAYFDAFRRKVKELQLPEANCNTQCGLGGPTVVKPTARPGQCRVGEVRRNGTPESFATPAEASCGYSVGCCPDVFGVWRTDAPNDLKYGVATRAPTDAEFAAYADPNNPRQWLSGAPDAMKSALAPTQQEINDYRQADGTWSESAPWYLRYGGERRTPTDDELSRYVDGNGNWKPETPTAIKSLRVPVADERWTYRICDPTPPPEVTVKISTIVGARKTNAGGGTDFYELSRCGPYPDEWLFCVPFGYQTAWQPLDEGPLRLAWSGICANPPSSWPTDENVQVATKLATNPYGVQIVPQNAAPPASGIAPASPFSPNGDEQKKEGSMLFRSDREGSYALSIKNSSGAEVKALSGSLLAGPNIVTWDGKNTSGAFVPEGLYTLTMARTDGNGHTSTAAGSRIEVDLSAPTPANGGFSCSPSGGAIQTSRVVNFSCTPAGDDPTSVPELQNAPNHSNCAQNPGACGAYEWQLDDNSDFSSLEKTAVGIPRNAYAADLGSLSTPTWYWRWRFVDAAGNPTAWKANSFMLQFACGNGVAEGSEQCDDGGTVSGDGCSSSCQLETCAPGPNCPAPDTTAPTVVSMRRSSNNLTNDANVIWTVNFSEPVTGVDAADFSLLQGGSVSNSVITAITNLGATYTVTVASGSGDGTLGLNLVDNDSIADAAGNRLGGAGSENGNFTGQAYMIQ